MYTVTNTHTHTYTQTHAHTTATSNTSVGLIMEKTTVASVLRRSPATRPRHGAALVPGDLILSVLCVCVYVCVCVCVYVCLRVCRERERDSGDNFSRYV